MRDLFDKIEQALTPPRDYKYSAGADVADSLALIVLAILVCLVLL